MCVSLTNNGRPVSGKVTLGKVTVCPRAHHTFRRLENVRQRAAYRLPDVSERGHILRRTVNCALIWGEKKTESFSSVGMDPDQV